MENDRNNVVLNYYPPEMYLDYSENCEFLKKECLKHPLPAEKGAFVFSIKRQHILDIKVESKTGFLRNWYSQHTAGDAFIGLDDQAIRRMRLLSPWIDLAIDKLKVMIHRIPVAQREWIRWSFTTGFCPDCDYYVDVGGEVKVLPAHAPANLSSMVLGQRFEVIVQFMCPELVEYVRKRQFGFLMPKYLDVNSPRTLAMLNTAIDEIQPCLQKMAEYPSMYDEDFVGECMADPEMTKLKTIDTELYKIKVILLNCNIDVESVGVFNLGRLEAIECIDYLKKMQMTGIAARLFPNEARALHQYLRAIGALVSRAFEWGQELVINRGDMGHNPVSTYLCKCLDLYRDDPIWISSPILEFGSFNHGFMPAIDQINAEYDSFAHEAYNEFYIRKSLGEEVWLG